jgi:sodium-dependent dicarboxylate transporter 2/3/5
MLERFTDRTLGWFNWMVAGVPLFLVAIVVFYSVLNWFFPPEMKTIPGGEAFLRQEREKLGPFSTGERATFAVFLIMVFAFIAPTVITLLMGPGHPVSAWLARSVSTWTVPPLMMILLFSIPTDWKKGQFILNWKDAADHTPWNIMFLCAAAVAVTTTLDDHGFVDWIGSGIQGLGLGPYHMLYMASYVMSFATNLVSGTAAVSLLGSILIPAAAQVGLNPATMAMLLPNMGVGLMLPWAGAVAGTVFASGEIEMKKMIRVGFVAEMIFAFLVATIHIILAPFL